MIIYRIRCYYSACVDAMSVLDAVEGNKVEEEAETHPVER